MDKSGSTGALTVHIPTSSTVAEAHSAALALWASVTPLTSCVLVKVRIKYKMREEAIATPDAGASIKRRGVFIYECGDGVPLALIEIPGIKDAVLSTVPPTDGYLIDAADAGVIAFDDAVISGLFTNPFADDIASLVTAYLQSRV